eukprot:TRINITY_DN5772_c0_g1_i1.p1 TRINITY_DN5772_c0_g1~~TRINITY_DN5772_c0_g1_i1.p1  ORF type:complete len:105 (-),score=6.98 TRINITY_DN5772_c0_g1_i1:217-531(-)
MRAALVFTVVLLLGFAFASQSNEYYGDPSGIKITIVGYTGKTIVEDYFEPTDTIHFLKGRVSSYNGMPVSLQEMYYNSILLDDLKTIESYGIKIGAIFRINRKW